MPLYRRIKRRLGYDTTLWEGRRVPEYEYVVTHLNGNQNTVRGHGYNTTDGFARFYRYEDAKVVPGLFGPSYSVWQTDQNILRVLEGIEEIEREKIGETRLSAVIDSADGTVLESECVFDVLSGDRPADKHRIGGNLGP